MVELNEKSKVKVHWKVTPYDYSDDKAKEIQVAFANKYGIPKDNIKVTPDFILKNTKGESNLITEGAIDNIQDPAFHKKLFKDYLDTNEVENYDMELIDSIDNEINARIDYQLFDNYRRFSIKWIKWSNFQSYGPDNSFDFTTLKGLTLLNSEPANQSGKTTFAVDLLHFLFFGKSEKWDTQDKLFNYCLPEETNVIVEGCLTVEGEDYIIKRMLSRPKLEKRTTKSKTTQKVEYYRVVGNDVEELEDFVELENGEDTRSTNKIIKESIGREDDFDLIMCITGSNLDDLIDEKPTEKGRLLSRWIGLLPLEQKDAIAREKFNQTIKPSLLTNQYNRETLKEEIEAYKVEIENLNKKTTELEETNKGVEKEIESLEDTKKTLLASKQQIDSNVLKIDITTLKAKLERKKQEGIMKKASLEQINNQIKELGNVEFSVEQYDKAIEEKTNKTVDVNNKRNEAIRIKNLIKQLQTSEYCPTCGRKLDNVDNSKQIQEQQAILDKLIEEGKKVNTELEKLMVYIESMKENREKYTKLNSLNTQKPVIELNIERLRSECLELINQEKEYNKNAEAIDKNNNLDISIRNTEDNIKTKRAIRDNNLRLATQYKANVEEYKKEITKREDIIKKITGEEKLVYNWKLYLEMVGKNGISKMVMRKALPIINARITQLLDEVCDFDVNVDINNKNEVSFNIVRYGVTSDLSSGSGFEKTAAALALRCVLADISTISRMNFLVLDEILGRVASENYDKMEMLYERISKGYDFIFHITHIDSVKDWHGQIITVVKSKEGISSLKQIQNVKKVETKQPKTEKTKTTKKTSRKKKTDD